MVKKRTEDIRADFHDRLLNFISQRIVNRTLAEDLLQEVYIKIHKGLPGLKDSQKLESWIFQITRNTITDFNRKGIQADLPRPELMTEDEEEDNITAEVAGWLVPFIRQLPTKYSEALMLADIKGISQKEIAERQNITLSGAKSRVQRGRVLLRKALDDCCKFEVDGRGNVLDYTPKSDNCQKC